MMVPPLKNTSRLGRPISNTPSCREFISEFRDVLFSQEFYKSIDYGQKFQDPLLQKHKKSHFLTFLIFDLGRVFWMLSNVFDALSMQKW